MSLGPTLPTISFIDGVKYAKGSEREVMRAVEHCFKTSSFDPDSVSALVRPYMYAIIHNN